MQPEIVVGLIGVLLVAGVFFVACRLLLGGWSCCGGCVSRLFGGRQAKGGSVRCPNRQCRTMNRAGARFCARCGQRLGNSAAVEDCDVTV